jgi:hypothetical protein
LAALVALAVVAVVVFTTVAHIDPAIHILVEVVDKV